jgi:hypothetical protein
VLKIAFGGLLRAGRAPVYPRVKNYRFSITRGQDEGATRQGQRERRLGLALTVRFNPRSMSFSFLPMIGGIRDARLFEVRR